MNLNHALTLAAMLVLIGIGVCIGYLVWGRQVIAIDEKPAAPIWHDDGSLTAIRAPDAKPTLPAPSAPPGGVLVRTVEVTVMPKPVADINPMIKGDTEHLTGTNKCAPVTVRLDMHEYRDGENLGLRVSVVSDGEILDAVDIPRDTIYMQRETRNAAAMVRAGDSTVVTVSRTFGALDVGVAAILPDGQRPAFGPALAYRW